LVLAFEINSKFPHFLNDEEFKVAQEEEPNISQDTFLLPVRLARSRLMYFLSSYLMASTTLGLCFLGCEKLNVFFMLSLDNIKTLVIHVSEINKVISEADAEGLNSFFLEVLSKPGVRAKKPEEEKKEENFKRLLKFN
jgi:hypothetical protein